MPDFMYFVFIFLAGLAVCLLFYLIKKSGDREVAPLLTKGYIVVRHQKIYFWIGVSSMAFWSFLLYHSIFVQNGSEEWWVFLCIVSADLLSILYTINAIMWRIYVFKNKNFFIYRSWFKTYKIKYSNCLWYKAKGSFVVIKTGYHTILFEKTILSSGHLLAMLRRYRIKRIK